MTGHFFLSFSYFGDNIFAVLLLRLLRSSISFIDAMRRVMAMAKINVCYLNVQSHTTISAQPTQTHDERSRFCISKTREKRKKIEKQIVCYFPSFRFSICFAIDNITLPNSPQWKDSVRAARHGWPET